MLQDAFVDKDGTPMAGGTVTCYQDTSRTTLKNWYYQSGTPGNYTYVRLPNPLTLSAAGTICDINGVDTIPFFYPYSELDQTERQPYFIRIENKTKTNVITRANFPFLPSEENEPGSGSHENYIINNVFWRNIGSMNLTAVTFATVAPSQHSTFRLPDICFFKSTVGGQDTVTFTKFPLMSQQILQGDPTPEYYLNHTCSNTPSGETQKAYFFPISLHVNTLAAFTFTATIQAQNVGGTAPGQNTINLFIYQDTGSGTTPPPPVLIGSITLTPSWEKYTFSSIFPATAGLTLSPVADDALYLIVQMPLNTNCSINFTKPSIYLSDDPPTNSFMTYEQIDSIINDARTGDIRTSLNSFSPFGWIPANDGTIGSAASAATTRANVDTWPLYSLIWGAVSDTYAPVTGGRGASAYADFTANKPMALTKTLSRFIGTAGAGAGLTAHALGQTAGVEAQSITLTAANLPPHSHTYVVQENAGINGFGLAQGTLRLPQTLNTGNGPGTSTPFVVATVPPSVFYNVFFKL